MVNGTLQRQGHKSSKKRSNRRNCMRIEIVKKVSFGRIFQSMINTKINTNSEKIYISPIYNIYICIILYLYICDLENNVPSQLSPQWLCGNSCTWAHDLGYIL